MTEASQLNDAIASALPSVYKYVPVPPRGPKTHPKKAKAIEQLFAIQMRLYKDIQEPETTPAARAQCARAWDVLEDRKRIYRGIGLPQQTPPKQPKQKQPRSSFTESAGPLVVPPVPKSVEPTTPDTTSKV